MSLVHFPAENTQAGSAVSNARLAAELQAVALTIHMFGFTPPLDDRTAGDEAAKRRSGPEQKPAETGG